jgi:hypothetical protein
VLHKVRASVPLSEPAGLQDFGPTRMRQPSHQVLPHSLHSAVFCKLTSHNKKSHSFKSLIDNKEGTVTLLAKDLRVL